MSFAYDSVTRYLHGIYEKNKATDTNPSTNGLAHLELLKKSTVVDITPVAEYFFASEQEEWDWQKDMPIAIPPFEFMWMEFRMPSRVTVESREIRELNTGGIDIRIGFSFLTKRKEDKGFAIVGSAFMVVNKKTDPPLFVVHYETDSQGMMTMVKNQEKEGFMESMVMPHFIRMMFPDYPEKPISDDGKKKLDELLGAYLRPCVLAMSFMSCKNVRTVLKRDAIGKINRAREREGVPPMVKVYTLEIAPLKDVLNAASGTGALSAKAMHICRGHFKDFSQGPGLFGKYKGRYWWPMAVKGSSAAGVVEKDYKVLSGK